MTIELIDGVPARNDPMRQPKRLIFGHVARSCLKYSRTETLPFLDGQPSCTSRRLPYVVFRLPIRDSPDLHRPPTR
jgi:hypothetical protein